MKASTRSWLDGLLKGSNSKALEIRDYIVKLEEENARLKEFSPYPEDNPEIKTVECCNANTALFKGYGS